MNRDERLRLSNCLDDYKLQEVAVVGAGTNCAVLSLNDLPAMKKSNSEMPKSKTLIRASSSSEVAVNGNEKKKRGIFGMFFSKTKKGSVSFSALYFLTIYMLISSLSDKVG